MRLRLFTIAFAMLVVGLHAQNLTFHNTLGSEAELQTSVVGPSLVPDRSGDGITYTSTKPAFAAGIDGAGVMLGEPIQYPLVLGSSAHMLTLSNRNAILNPDRGTIECVFRLLDRPATNIFEWIRLVDGPFGDDSGIGLVVSQGVTGPGTYDPSQTRIYFYFPNKVGFDATSAQVVDLGDRAKGANITDQIHNWLHVAAVWDRAGIDGTIDRMRIYVNDQLKAVSRSPIWTHSFGDTFDIGGCRSFGVGRYTIDDLKFYDGAKTSFPQTPHMAILPMLWPNSVSITNSMMPLGHYVVNVFTFDAANANGGLGKGWLGGLNVGFADAMQQIATFTPPFVNFTDDLGSTRYLVMNVPQLCGSTVYAVGITVDPASFGVDGYTAPIAYTFP